MVFIAIHSLRRIPVILVVGLCLSLRFFVVEFSSTQLHFHWLENQSHLPYATTTTQAGDALR